MFLAPTERCWTLGGDVGDAESLEEFVEPRLVAFAGVFLREGRVGSSTQVGNRLIVLKHELGRIASKPYPPTLR
ncbi:hypothetical protein [Natronoarchaeum sp. GCM10025703]|uniref:hypothetical protein n=1 Tax=Natronoarchaeum sp. GCM10025703 TaxID=3252685 RepID=UPI003670CB71